MASDVELARVLIRMSSVIDRALTETGMTRLQARLLRVLADGPAFGVALAARLAVSRPNFTPLVDGLIEKGLIDRQVDELDRRRNRYSLTPAGKKALAAAEESVAQRLGRILGNLGGAEATATRAAAPLLEQALDAEWSKWVAQRAADRAAGVQSPARST